MHFNEDRKRVYCITYAYSCILLRYSIIRDLGQGLIWNIQCTNSQLSSKSEKFTVISFPLIRYMYFNGESHIGFTIPDDLLLYASYSEILMKNSKLYFYEYYNIQDSVAILTCQANMNL